MMSIEKQKRRDYINKYRRLRAKMDLKYKIRRGLGSLKYKHKVRIEILKLLGSECKKCGFSDWRALQVDHIDGKGHIAHKKINFGKFKLLREIKKYPEKYQLLCANCNWIKRYENDETSISKEIKEAKSKFKPCRIINV